MQISVLSVPLLILVILTACAPTPASPTDPSAASLTVFAAASLTDAFTEIGGAFESAHPGVDVRFSFAGSQTLRAQIEQGAAADVFASANASEMEALVDGRFVPSGDPQTFATNQLLVVLPADNPAGISTLADLASPGVKLVLAAEEVPAGRYARQALENLNATLGAEYSDNVLANVVSNETDVRQVLAKVQLGEADAGIVYMSDALTAPGLPKIQLPAEANVLAMYPIAALSEGPNQALARQFIDYVLSSQGQATLRKWGFTSPTQK